MPPRTALCLFATLFIVSCTGASRVRPERVPLAELPDSYQELCTAWLEEAPDWGERREEGSAFALYRVGQEALQALTGTTGRRSVREWGEWYRTWEVVRKKTRDTGN